MTAPKAPHEKRKRGPKPRLPPGTRQRQYRLTDDEHARVAEFIRQLRASGKP